MRVSERSVDNDVVVVRWPAEATTRTLLAREGRARVLLVAAECPAPHPIDDLEDWLRDPADPVELVARTDALRRRAATRESVPVIDEHGLLHFDDRWVAVSDAQLPIIRLLVERFGQLVRHEELFAAYIAAGGTENTSSIRTALTRVRYRVAQVGLSLESARQRGVVLDVARRNGG
jgi:hypothetical protein